MAKRPVYCLLNWLFLRFIFVLPLLPIGYQIVRYRQGMEGIFPPGPLAAAHESVACKQCHVEPWRGWRRVLRAGHQTAAAMDGACAQCHRELLDDRSPKTRVGHGFVVPPPAIAPHHPRQLFR
jgi:hypothetical protein